jgi:hypothetical protein
MPNPLVFEGTAVRVEELPRLPFEALQVFVRPRQLFADAV